MTTNTPHTTRWRKGAATALFLAALSAGIAVATPANAEPNDGSDFASTSIAT